MEVESWGATKINIALSVWMWGCHGCLVAKDTWRS